MTSPFYARGPVGASLLTGTGSPGAGFGFDGDMYIDSGPTAGKGNLYSKVSGVWVLEGNVAGPQGNQGIPGPLGIVLHWAGPWNAATNTPTLADGVGTQGDAWLTQVAGTHNLGSGSLTFAAGDYAAYNGTRWYWIEASLITATGQIIPHGTNATYVRPPGLIIGDWVGPVVPTNAQNGDVWDDTSGTAPTILTTSLTPLNIGVSTTQQLVVTGTQPITWLKTDGTYPTNVSVSSDGILTANPVSAVSYDFTMTATSGYAPPAVQRYTGTIGASVAPTITTTALGGTPTAGVFYTQTILITGSDPKTLALQSGALPAGLTLSGITISGTPTTAGTYASFTLRATNTTTGLFDDQIFSGSINGSAPYVTTTILDPMSQGALYSPPNGFVPIVFGTPPITFTTGPLSSDASLPAGIHLNTTTNNGALYGTPTGTTPYDFTYTATNTYGSNTAHFTGSISPGNPVVTTLLGPMYRNVPINIQMGFTGATPITWSHTGTFPTGVTFIDGQMGVVTNAGLLAGSPTTTGEAYNFSITATNSYGTNTATYGPSTVLESTAVISPSSLSPPLTNGTPFTQTLSATGYGPFTWSPTAVAGAIPSWMTWTPATQILTGTPAGSSYDLTLRVTNGIGVTTDQRYNAAITSSAIVYNNHQGTFTTGSGTSWSATGPTVTTENALVVFATYVNGTGSGSSTLTATYNGVAMHARGQVAYNTAGAGMYIACFVSQAIDHPGGVLPSAQPISITSSLNVTWRIQSEVYANVVTIGSESTQTGSTNTPSIPIPSGDQHMVVGCAASYQSSAGLQGTFIGNMRENQAGNLSIWYQTFAIIDKATATGTTSTTIGSTLVAASAWAMLGIDLKNS